MKKLNIRGFSTVEAILLIVIIGVISGIGYYVYNSQKKTNQILDNTSKVVGDPQKVVKTYDLPEEQKPTRSEITAKKEYTYAYGSNKLFYTPPAGWNLEEYSVEFDKTYRQETGKIQLMSPDYKEGEIEGICRIDTGKTMWISIMSTTDGNDKMIQEKLNPPAEIAAFSKNQKEVTLGGQKAVQYQSSPGECGYSTSISTVKNGYSIFVSAKSDQSTTAPYLDSPYDSIYKSLVSSIRFE